MAPLLQLTHMKNEKNKDLPNEQQAQKKPYEFGTIEKIELEPREEELSVFARIDITHGSELSPPIC